MAKLHIDLIRDLNCDIRKAIELENKRPRAIKNFTQMQILVFLLNNPDNTIYQKDIGEALKLKKSSITEHLDYLEMIGAIERVQDKTDKRKNSIRLSEKAIIRKSEIDDSLKYLDERIIAGIDKKDLETFEKVVKKMGENLK